MLHCPQKVVVLWALVASFASGPTQARPIVDDISVEYRKALQTLWQDYKVELLANYERRQEHTQRVLTYRDKTMKFSMERLGRKPAQGFPLYIALHGGGSTPRRVNDRQWDHMKVYYKATVKKGIYVAPRGVADTWNLHFVSESYYLYHRLIENMIAFEEVDPNRVYILGFSAGGDGVYQIAPRMSQRFAAANMSAGHHNGVKLDNLYNTPFLIQMGELDIAYKRNRVAAQNYIRLKDLQAEHGGYIHDAYIHPNHGHNGWRDNDQFGRPQEVFASPDGWLIHRSRKLRTLDTNAIHWVRQHQREAYPRRIIWDLETRAPTPLNNLNLWLKVEGRVDKGARIDAEIMEGFQTIRLNQVRGVASLVIRVKPGMLDMNREIFVEIEGETLPPLMVECNTEVMAQTLEERGDPSLVACGEIHLIKSSEGRWFL